jgi:type VI secretion system secreted protein VgrG
MPRVMEITTPLGADVLLFHGMHAREELSRLFEFQLNLLSMKNDIAADDILGKNVTVKLALPDDSTRHFNGYVTRFSAGGKSGRYSRYTAVVRPWLWYLTRTSDCRIFQDMDVPTILKAVFDDHPDVADVKFELTGAYRKWTYCVQYRETDFNFISRLMEHEGIYYYFRHTDGKNTLVCTDSTAKHTPTPLYKEISFIAPDDLARPELEHISSWSFSREVQPGVYVHDDYDLERPSVELKTRKELARTYSPSKYEMYDYPGHYIQTADGSQYAGVRIDELGTQFEGCYGSSNARGICVGSLFTLADCPRGDQNREHLVLSSSYDMEFSDYEALPRGEGTRCSCSFVAMPTSQQFRPRRITPKPFVQGPQTALVVGPAGEEIYTDKYGRVKVQFHWDRRGEKNENSSCWIRVSHPWAGKAWGAVAIPRMGQEVIVDFLEGDPDQPIITGRVYNAEQMPPYDLPANKTQTGYKTRSSLSGTADNCNEIRFEDKKGSEQLYIHAEKNQDISVENDETHTVGHDRTKTIDHDETSHIKHDRTETVDNNETITIGVNRTEKVGANEKINIGANRDIVVSSSETATVALQRTHTVGINETITVGAAQEITVGAMQAITVGASQSTNVGVNQSTDVGSNRTVGVGSNQTTKVGKNESTSIGADEARKVTGGRSTNIGKDDSLKVAKNYVLDAGDSITIKTGDASITMKKDGTIQIKGRDITIKGSGKINVDASTSIRMKASKITQN